MNLLLLLPLLAQQPQVQATIDKSVAEVGDDIVVTVKVVAEGGIPTEASVPPFTGLDLTGTSQSSVFTTINGRGRRETVWEYRFRAVTPGRAVIGPIRVRVGADFVVAGELSVDVTSAGGAGGEAFDKRVAEIIDRAPGPGMAEDVTVTVIPSRDTLVLGEQLDLVVVAWFPRDIRSRLRTRPTLMPPELQGAWTYPRTAALGVADTRTVDGRLYDLFVHHQVAFPLTPGELRVGHATVSYSLPLRTSILSREMPQEVQSPDTAVTVLPQPVQGRPDVFTGVAARDLQFTVAVDTGDFGVGNASTITARVTGQGNVALWPKPEFAWPEGVRVYEGRTDVVIDAQNGLIGGTKTFTYLVAPESTGTYVVPPPTYTYFALDSGRYVQATTPRIQLVARAVRPSSTADLRPPAIMARRGVSLLDSLVTNTSLWLFGLILGLPPALAGMVRVAAARIRRRGKPMAESRQTDPTLETLEREFRARLEQLVPGLHAREGDGLPAALRAAGVEAPVATHASRVRDRLRQAVYGPGGASDPLELTAEVHEVLRALPVGTRQGSGVVRVASVAGLMMLVGTGLASAQTPSAEQLYEAGAYRTAADSFSARASEEPLDASQWFNTGAALFGAGGKTAARGAWIRAARIAPRDRVVRAALELVPPLDAQARSSTWIAPVTAFELAAAAMVFWVVGWLVYTFSSRARRVAMSLVALGVVSAALGAYLQHRYNEPVGLITSPNVPVLEAPYGTADATTRLEEGTAVRIVDEAGPWLRISRGVSQGWVLTIQVWRL